MPEALGFDIYGTLVDPLEMDEHLREVVGEGVGRAIGVLFSRAVGRSGRPGTRPRRPVLVVVRPWVLPRSAAAYPGGTDSSRTRHGRETSGNCREAGLGSCRRHRPAARHLTNG